MNNCNTRSHVGPLSLSLISEGGASPGVYPHKMSDPGTHAIEGPALVISHSARKVVGGATPLVNNYSGVYLLVHATISLLDGPTVFRITVAKGRC